MYIEDSVYLLLLRPRYYSYKVLKENLDYCSCKIDNYSSLSGFNFTLTVLTLTVVGETRSGYNRIPLLYS